MNINRLNQQREEAKAKAYSFSGSRNAGYAFPLLGIKNLECGSYLMRVVWSDPVKNPDGMQIVSTSTVETMEGTKKASVRFLTPDMLAPGEGYLGVQQVLKYLDESGLYEKIREKGDSTKTLRAAIDKLDAWRRYWLPVWIWAREVPPQTAGAYSTYVPTTENERPLDRILEINENVKIVQQLFDAFTTYPSLDSARAVDGGRNLYIRVYMKGAIKVYELEMDPKGCTDLAPDLCKHTSDNYPNLPELMRKFYFRAPSEIASLCQSQWWANTLKSANVIFPDHVDNSLSDLRPDTPATTAVPPSTKPTEAEEGGMPWKEDAVGSVDTVTVEGVQTVKAAAVVRRPPPPRKV